MSTRAESLRLYRDILRATRLFTWNNNADYAIYTTGEPWSKILKLNARKEFESFRYETDALIIHRLLVVGRDCLIQTTEKMAHTAKAINDNIDKTRTR